MNVRVLVGVYCLVAAAVLAEVQARGTNRKTTTRPAGGPPSPPPPPPTRTSSPVTTPSMKTVTGRSSQAQATTNESISNQTTAAAMHETETTAHAAMTTVSTINETEADISSSITTPMMDTESEQMTLVMAIVGSVVGLLLLLVVVVCVITICTAAASRQKIKTSPGLNNIDHSLDNPTYGNKEQQEEESEMGGAKPTEGHIYQVLERPPLQPSSAAHAYEIVDCDTEDDSSTGTGGGSHDSSTGGVSQLTTASSCNSSSDTEKKRCTHHEYEIVPSFNNAPRSRLSNYDHLIEKDGGATSHRRHSLNDRLSFSTATHEYDTIHKKEMIQNTIKTSDDYSALEVHGYAVLRPHPSATRSPGGRSMSTTQDGEYSHLMHH